MKNKAKVIIVSTVFVVIAMAVSCKKGNMIVTESTPPNLPARVYDYQNIEVSGAFRQFKSNNFSNQVSLSDLLNISPNRDIKKSITNERITLGRVLFYDKKMSLNNTVSCGSCHQQSLAFSDGLSSSEGFAGKTTPRNSMTIVNPFLNNNMFWDSRTPTVRELTLQPVFNHLEMGMESSQKLVEKISATEYYKPLFKSAYGSEDVSEAKIADAMTQFLCSMVSANSKFDKGLETNFSNFDDTEMAGKNLFFGVAKCSMCHSGNNFSAPDFIGGDYGAPEIKGTANIGLNRVYKDNGKGDGKFKIPSLRNIALTAPYMHDGRFKSLSEVVEHYNSGIQEHPSLDSKFRNSLGKPQRLNLTTSEKYALVAFLNTLTDKSLIEDVKFSDPFIK